MKKLDELIRSAQKKVSTPQEKVRLERVLKYLWRPAVQGKIDYENFKIRRQTPPRMLDVFRCPDAGS